MSTGNVVDVLKVDGEYLDVIVMYRPRRGELRPYHVVCRSDKGESVYVRGIAVVIERLDGHVDHLSMDASVFSRLLRVAFNKEMRRYET